MEGARRVRVPRAKPGPLPQPEVKEEAEVGDDPSTSGPSVFDRVKAWSRRFVQNAFPRRVRDIPTSPAAAHTVIEWRKWVSDHREHGRASLLDFLQDVIPRYPGESPEAHRRRIARSRAKWIAGYSERLVTGNPASQPQSGPPPSPGTGRTPHASTRRVRSPLRRPSGQPAPRNPGSLAE